MTSSPLVIPLPGNESLASALPRVIGGERGEATVRRFPDGESYVRLLADPFGRDVVVVAALDRPDDKILSLLLLVETARELGAASVGLCAPYLPYMRQDKRFNEGEAVSARLFPRFLGRSVDWLVTVDPHLHRIHDLAEVWSIPATAAHAAPAIATWLTRHVDRPLLIGPDEESAQWAEEVARRAEAPCVVLNKIRHGDRDVAVTVADVEKHADRTPVLIDDIISTGRTMAETLGHLRRAGMRAGVCIGVHALFAPGAMDDLKAAGAARIVTCDSVPHTTNGIAIAPALAHAINEHLAAR